MSMLAYTFFALMISIPVVPQGRDSFIIDPSKPYVYIKFYRLAERRPVSDTESRTGLWLRLTNNCRVPVIVRTFDPGTEDQGVAVEYDVIPVVIPIQGGPVGSSKSSKVEGEKEVPKGYSFDVGSVTTIPPGTDLLFSVPANHVNPSWYVRVKFEFGLPKTNLGAQPVSYVTFSWSDIPAQYRK